MTTLYTSTYISANTSFTVTYKFNLNTIVTSLEISYIIYDNSFSNNLKFNLTVENENFVTIGYTMNGVRK